VSSAPEDKRLSEQNTQPYSPKKRIKKITRQHLLHGDDVALRQAEEYERRSSSEKNNSVTIERRLPALSAPHERALSASSAYIQKPTVSKAYSARSLNTPSSDTNGEDRTHPKASTYLLLLLPMPAIGLFGRHAFSRFPVEIGFLF
jgi:hypothetical protein